MNDSIVIYLDSDGYEVWCGVDGDNIINAHIIGCGTTRDDAVRAAVEHLESELELLQSPIGVMREVDVRSK